MRKERNLPPSVVNLVSAIDQVPRTTPQIRDWGLNTNVPSAALGEICP